MCRNELARVMLDVELQQNRSNRHGFHLILFDVEVKTDEIGSSVSNMMHVRNARLVKALHEKRHM
jgi:hypothetical protein